MSATVDDGRRDRGYDDQESDDGYRSNPRHYFLESRCCKVESEWTSVPSSSAVESLYSRSRSPIHIVLDLGSFFLQNIFCIYRDFLQKRKEVPYCLNFRH